MKQFLAVYIGKASSFDDWRAMDEAEREEREAAGMQAWSAWMEKYASATTVPGGPLGKTKRAGPNGISDIKNTMTGYIVVQAESHETAARMFENHPHFAIFPGDSVEIMECLPIPGM